MAESSEWKSSVIPPRRTPWAQQIITGDPSRIAAEYWITKADVKNKGYGEWGEFLQGCQHVDEEHWEDCLRFMGFFKASRYGIWRKFGRMDRLLMGRKATYKEEWDRHHPQHATGATAPSPFQLLARQPVRPIARSGQELCYQPDGIPAPRANPTAFPSSADPNLLPAVRWITLQDVQQHQFGINYDFEMWGWQDWENYLQSADFDKNASRQALEDRKARSIEAYEKYREAYTPSHQRAIANTRNKSQSRPFPRARSPSAPSNRVTAQGPAAAAANNLSDAENERFYDPNRPGEFKFPEQDFTANQLDWNQFS